MEQHPVPQNVTTFQFRLIGDMTIKQFGYLAIGTILGYLCYKLPLPIFFTWPLAALFFFGGIGFAFVPIEERPMDVWVLSFFKSIYSPTQFLWSRRTQPGTAGQQPLPPAVKVDGKKQAVKSDGKITESALPPQEVAQRAKILTLYVGRPLDRLFATLSALLPKPKPAAPETITSRPDVAGVPLRALQPAAPASPAPTAAAEESLTLAQKKGQVLEEKVHQLETELKGKTVGSERILELQKQLTQLLSDKQRLEEELITLRQKMTLPQAPTLPPRMAGIFTPTEASPTVRVIAPQASVKAGLPRLTTFPNVIAGIVKDNQNNLLPGVLVTVRDKDDVPMRALKTNKLGQFAASTPLPNGTYLIEIEDPRDRYIFDQAKITVSGSLLPTIEIIAKSPKELERAKLAQQIFGDKTM